MEINNEWPVVKTITGKCCAWVEINVDVLLQMEIHPLPSVYTILARHSWIYLSPFDVNSREDLQPPATECPDRWMWHANIPRGRHQWCQLQSNPLLRIPNHRLPLFLLQWFDPDVFLSSAQALPLHRPPNCYSFPLRQCLHSLECRHLILAKFDGCPEEEDFSIMDVSKLISSRLKLLEGFIPQFTRYFDGKTENEVFQQYTSKAARISCLKMSSTILFHQRIFSYSNNTQATVQMNCSICTEYRTTWRVT